MGKKVTHGFRTTDPAAAMEHLRSSYGRLNLQGPSFTYEVNAAADHRFSIGSVLLGGQLVAEGATDGFTVVAGPERLRWEVDDDRGNVDSAPVLFHPGVPLHVEADHARVRVVRFDTRQFERLARLAFDNPNLQLGFDGSRPISRARAAHWDPVLRSVSDLGEDLNNDLIRASAYRELAVATLGIFRFEHTSSRRPVTSRGAAVAYQAAVAFIDDNAHRPITVEDVASRLGATSRELRGIFLHHSSPPEGPAERIRRVRLSAAHLDITAGTADLTLGEIAARWGFSQAGFVRHYRRIYGTHPLTALTNGSNVTSHRAGLTTPHQRRGSGDAQRRNS